MKKKELEIKKIISNENEFEIIYNYFSNNDLYKLKKIVQKNFYFDTENFYFFKRNISIKLRMIDEIYRLIVKQQKKWDLLGRESEEFIAELDEKQALDMLLYSKIPNELENYFVQQKMPSNIFYKGAMITERTVINHEDFDFTICLDLNNYLGKQDFELEVEYSYSDNIQLLLSEILNKLPDSKWSKYGRFSRSILKSTDNHCKVQASVIIENSLGEILLIKKEKVKSTIANKLIPPGGHVGFFESIEDAARREVIEETNIDLEKEPLCLSAIVYFRNTELLKNSICFFFYVKLPDDFNLTYKSKEFDIEPNWINLFDKENISSNKLTKYHLQIIEHARLEKKELLYLDIQTDKGIIRSYK